MQLQETIQSHNYQYSVEIQLGEKTRLQTRRPEQGVITKYLRLDASIERQKGSQIKA